MKVISTQIGREREVLWQGEPIKTGIFKEPVDGITIKKFYVVGDTVSDPSVHGGEDKSVYGYASEHYPYWRREFPPIQMPWGTFGENITTEGLLEHSLIIGSVYRIGTALLQVTEPRLPCYKLAAKFNTVDIISRFMKSKKSGFYFTVIDEGIVKPGDSISLEQMGDERYSIQDVVESYLHKG